jgi:hypothetical protein
MFVLLMAILSTTYSYAILHDFRASSDDVNVTYSFKYTDAPTHMRVFLDSDRNLSTGFPINGVGAEYLIENNNLFRYSGSNGLWSWHFLKTIAHTKDKTSVSFVVARSDLNSPLNMNVLAQYASPSSSSRIVSQTLREKASAKVDLQMSQVNLDKGNTYIVYIDINILGDSSSAPSQSKLQLYENGLALGPAHSSHESIRTLGKGRFSHWGSSLRFSTSDNSNPHTNKRTYSYSLLTEK